MPKFTFRVPVPCERCANPEQDMEASRESGMGAEMLLKCPACGHESFGDISESISRELSELARRQEPGNLQ